MKFVTLRAIGRVLTGRVKPPVVDYYVIQGEDITGPFEQQQLIEEFRRGKISEEAQITPTDETVWAPFRTVFPDEVRRLRAERDGNTAHRMKRSQFCGAGTLIQLLGLFVIFLPPWILTVPLGLIVMVVGHGMAKGLKCSECGTKLPDPHARRCAGCRAEFLD